MHYEFSFFLEVAGLHCLAVFHLHVAEYSLSAGLCIQTAVE